MFANIVSMNTKLGFPSLMTVGEAAAYLGVCRSTLRNWDARGKLLALRHPVSSYRLYSRHALDLLLSSITSSPQPDPSDGTTETVAPQKK